MVGDNLVFAQDTGNLRRAPSTIISPIVQRVPALCLGLGGSAQKPDFPNFCIFLKGVKWKF